MLHFFSGLSASTESVIFHSLKMTIATLPATNEEKCFPVHQNSSSI